MRLFTLQGHYGRQVVVDLCEPCRLVWFDTLESVNLAGRGWIELLRRLQQAAAAEAPWLGQALGCPLCRAPLQPVHNLTRFGRCAALECRQGHGHLQSFALLLAERGLVRPLLPPERAQLADAQRSLACLNCGASLQGSDGEACTHCASPLVMIDLPRLAAALRVRPGEPLPTPDGRLAAWHCAGCGQAIEPTRRNDCDRCGQLIVVPSMAALGPLLDVCEAEWWKHQQAPAARPAYKRRAPDPEPWRATSFARLLGNFGPRAQTLGGWIAAGTAALLVWLWLR
ncbi:hypothetical protein HLB44_32970 [Aquincola sp. S2]|uniref:Transcription factor zinc-finger domain-containing protein n=1 Tax=Pseudaquabacterium terrae TaxID=2732868 RepID=A0ABX2ESY1_9BURK|nr:hypothetical protein [Aquabacterium terrae]NRF71809.1 hypothetical protein [Aquabacterium terrae]